MEGRRIIWRRKKYEEETDKVEEIEIIYLYISIFINHPSISTFLSSLSLSLSSVYLSVHPSGIIHKKGNHIKSYVLGTGGITTLGQLPCSL